MASNTATIVGIEAAAAAQGIEFRRPLRSSDVLEAQLTEIRSRVAPYRCDRFFAPDIEAMKNWVSSARLPPDILGLLLSRSLESVGEDYQAPAK
jgi:histidine ammonia-lyase